MQRIAPRPEWVAVMPADPVPARCKMPGCIRLAHNNGPVCWWCDPTSVDQCDWPEGVVEWRRTRCKGRLSE